MKILILNSDYKSFLHWLYRDNPGLSHASYAHQSQVRNASLFGVADFYSRNFIAHGHEAQEIHVNNPWLQWAWGREHGLQVEEPEPWTETPGASDSIEWIKRIVRPFKPLLAPAARAVGLIATLADWQRRVLFSQVEAFNPDYILDQSVGSIDASTLRSLRQPGRKFIAQLGVEPSANMDTSVYDMGISQLPWVVQYFKNAGLPAHQHHLGFEPEILGALGPPPDQEDIPLSFVGALSAAHSGRISFLEAIARKFPLKIWVPSLAVLQSSSPLRECWQGEAWGRDMYAILRRSRIVLNSHIEVARGGAGNMRLFEATGVGAFLLTDGAKDIQSLFNPSVEVELYDSLSDCLEKIDYFLNHEVERRAIAAEGQKRTLSAHNYFSRTRELLGHIQRL